MKMFECETIAEVLNSEFLQRKDRNSAYSLRAFARDLNMSPSSLSEVLSGKRGLSEKSAEVISERLKFRLKEKLFLKDLTLAENARNIKVREHARKRINVARNTQRYKNLNEDEFLVIADWHHSAILELIHVEGFESSDEWIAERLGVSSSEVRVALERLEKLGMVKRKGKKYEALPDAYNAIIEKPSPAVRRFQRQIISMSAQSLFEDSGSEREILSMIFAIPRSQIPEFRLEMRKFISDFWQKIEKVPKDDLYSFSMQLCPVKNRRKTRA